MTYFLYLIVDPCLVKEPAQLKKTNVFDMVIEMVDALKWIFFHVYVLV